MIAAVGIDQLHVQPNPRPRLSDAPLQNDANSQDTADLSNVGLLALERVAGGPCDDPELGNSRQRPHQLIGHAVAEILAVGLPTEIGEWEHRDARFAPG